MISISIQFYYSFSFNYNATLYAILMEDSKTIKVYKLEEEKEIAELNHEYYINTIAFNSCKTILATAC